jgi:hypothetical protein
MPYLTIDGTAWPVAEGSTRLEYLGVQQARRAIDATLVVDAAGGLIRLSVTIGPLSRADAQTLRAALRAPGFRTVGGDVLEGEGGAPLAMHVEGMSRSDVAHRPPGKAATWMPQVEVTLVQVAPS